MENNFGKYSENQLQFSIYFQLLWPALKEFHIHNFKADVYFDFGPVCVHDFWSVYFMIEFFNWLTVFNNFKFLFRR